MSHIVRPAVGRATVPGGPAADVRELLAIVDRGLRAVRDRVAQDVLLDVRLALAARPPQPHGGDRG